MEWDMRHHKAVFAYNWMKYGVFSKVKDESVIFIS